MKTFGPFRLDAANQCLWHADKRAPLTPKAFDVLRYLVEHAGHLVTQDELLEALWSGTYVNPEGIRKYILEIRKVLGDQLTPPVFIQTLPKRGYEFVAPVTDESRTARLDRAAPGNMVGRHVGITRLENYFQKALDGQRQAVFVTGEAGIGKTTLVDAFQEQVVRQPDVRIARGQCIEGFGGKEAYYPMLEAIGSLIRDATDSSLVQTLTKHAPTWLIQFPAMMKPEQRESLQREILGSTRERMVREICEALEVITAQTPLIVILEDLHWADHSTLDLISALARRRESAKLLLLGTYRPVDVVLSQSPLKTLKQDLLVRQLCQEIAVERLEEPDVAEYLVKMFSADTVPQGLVNMIHHNSGGNPLFMGAIVQEMVNRGLIAEDRGELNLTAPLQEVYPGIPETLQQMLEIQFEQLSPDEQRMLECGSVAGERFSVWAIAAMAESPSAAIEEACERLVNRQQFIRPAGTHQAPNGAASTHYEFRHSLYRQALYRRLSGSNRSKLHQTLAERLMPFCDAGKRELASELALHFEEGHDHEHAMQYLMLTAENAARRFAYRDSIQILRHALELSSARAPGAGRELEIQILQRAGDTHFALGEMSDSAVCYRAAADQAGTAGLITARVRALIRLAAPAWYIEPERADEVCRQALEASEGLDDPLLAAQARLSTASVRLLYTEWREENVKICAQAQEMIRRLSGSNYIDDVYYIYVQGLQGAHQEAMQQADAVVFATTNPTVYMQARGAKGLALLFSGRLGEFLELLRTGRELAEKNGEDAWMFIFGEAWLSMLCGDYHSVRRLSQITMRSDTEPHAAWLRTVYRISSGYEALHQGRFDEALQYFREVIDFQTTPRFFLHWHWRLRARIGSTEARLSAGDLEGAHREADAFLEGALAAQEPNMQARAWEIQSRVARAGNDTRGARECIENALAILERFDIPMSAWHVHRTAWDLCADEGDHERANGHRARAKELIMRLVDSFHPEEPLRQFLLTAPTIQRVLQDAASA